PPTLNGIRQKQGAIRLSVFEKGKPLQGFDVKGDFVHWVEENGFEPVEAVANGREILVDGNHGVIYEDSVHGGEQFTELLIGHESYIYSIAAWYEDKGVPSKMLLRLLSGLRFK